MRNKLAKHYRCQWLLQKSVPLSNAENNGTLVNEDNTTLSENCHNSGQIDISNKTKKRSKRTYEDIETQLSAVQEERFSFEKHTILLSTEKKTN